jgi:hypothetical protein
MLVEHGLVNRSEAGAALLFTLNRQPLAGTAIEQQASLRSSMIERRQSELKT